MGQSFTCLYYHVIFGTKHRQPYITPELQHRLYDYIGGIVRRENGDLLSAGGTSDHVHLLVSLHARATLSDTLRVVKTNSSKWIHDTFPDRRAFAWQSGYGAFTVSHSNLAHVKRYIAEQKAHHAGRTFEEEFVAFLERHGLGYDPQYLWR